MKIALVTIYDEKNYGNRLQNFALQKFLTNMGHEVKTIVYRSPIGKLHWGIVNMLLEDNMKKRRKNFLKFIDENIYEVKPKNLKNVSNDFDVFIVGSDQIWNPHFCENSKLKFLKFTDKRKRVAYAPSIGVSKLPKRFEKSYKIGISNFSSLSIRESAGAEIIKKLGINNTKVLVDPTMLLTKEEWQAAISKTSIYFNRPYLLTYFLGSKKNYEQRIKNIASKYGLDIINLNDLSQPNYYSIDPFEFVNYIGNAKIVCTDSFHGAVFSILNRVPFLIFNRQDNVKSMNSRMDTLLEKTNLNNRLAVSIDDKDIFSIDFSEAEGLLEKEREMSKNFLEEAFKKVIEND